MSNQLVKIQEQFSLPDNEERFKKILGKNTSSFIASVLQIISSKTALQNAEPESIVNVALTAATLGLPINNNLGFAYIVPYNHKYKDAKGVWQTRQVAQFQMGYKGFIQLAQRSGQFKSIYATPIYEGQITESNPLEGYQFDFTKKISDNVIGYASKFKLLNGFEATWYMTIEQLKAHGSKYSKSFAQDNGLWNTDFDAMASKTVIKLLLSKFAPLSIDMQRAVISDQSVINNVETMDVSYVDNDDLLADPSKEEIKNKRLEKLIENAQTREDLEKFEKYVTEAVKPLFKNKMAELV